MSQLFLMLAVIGLLTAFPSSPLPAQETTLRLRIDSLHATTDLKGESLERIFFVDSLHGWVSVAAAPGRAAFETSDAGRTWRPTNAFRPVHFLSDSLGEALSHEGFYSADSGATWSPLQVRLDGVDSLLLRKAVLAEDGTIVVAYSEVASGSPAPDIRLARRARGGLGWREDDTLNGDRLEIGRSLLEGLPEGRAGIIKWIDVSRLEPSGDVGALVEVTAFGQKPERVLYFVLLTGPRQGLFVPVRTGLRTTWLDSRLFSGERGLVVAHGLAHPETVLEADVSRDDGESWQGRPIATWIDRRHFEMFGDTIIGLNAFSIDAGRTWKRRGTRFLTWQTYYRPPLLDALAPHDIRVAAPAGLVAVMNLHDSVLFRTHTWGPARCTQFGDEGEIYVGGDFGTLWRRGPNVGAWEPCSIVVESGDFVTSTVLTLAPPTNGRPGIALAAGAAPDDSSLSVRKFTSTDGELWRDGGAVESLTSLLPRGTPTLRMRFVGRTASGTTLFFLADERIVRYDAAEENWRIVDAPDDVSHLVVENERTFAAAGVQRLGAPFVYFTSDGGASWDSSRFTPISGGYGCLGIDTLENGDLAATFGPDVASRNRGALYRRDSLDRWQLYSITLPLQFEGEAPLLPNQSLIVLHPTGAILSYQLDQRRMSVLADAATAGFQQPWFPNNGGGVVWSRRGNRLLTTDGRRLFWVEEAPTVYVPSTNRARRERPNGLIATSRRVRFEVWQEEGTTWSLVDLFGRAVSQVQVHDGEVTIDRFGELPPGWYRLLGRGTSSSRSISLLLLQ